MTEKEYKEHIQYTHNAYCQIVIRHASIDVARMLFAKWKREITIPAFKVVSVFDVSQTEGRELSAIGVDELTGSVEKYNDYFKAITQASPVPVGFEKIEGGAHGYYHLEEKRIAVNEGMSELQNLKTLIHEIAHAKLHDVDLNAPAEQRADSPDSRTREVQAESIAYDIFKIPYLKRLSNATVTTVKSSVTLSICINFIAVTCSLLRILNPTIGALVHNVGSGFVVLIAVHLVPLFLSLLGFVKLCEMI